MNEKEIKAMLLNGECVTLECKRAKNEVPRSVWETYSAFANTVGGMILLGIEENRKERDVKKRFRIIGVDDAQKIVNDFWNTINSDKVNENILCSSDVDTVEINNVQIVCIHVPQADWRIKPIYLNGNVYKGTYRRNHEGDYHCTERQVRAMIRDSFEDGNDGMLIEYYDLNDIDMDTLKRYRTLFQYRNDGHVWNEVDDKTFLKNLGGYTIDRATGKEGLTMAGLMMFGKGLSVQERFANFRMDYLDFCNLIGDERYSDRLTYDGRWENNLYQFFSRVMPKVTADLPRPFRMEGIQRVDDTPQHKAVREAFTNAIIHSDLLMDAGILRIEKHDDRLCFRNPGLLKLPIETIYEGGNSKARNPRIQNMLRMIGYGENVGSGFPTIISAWKDALWGEPELKNKIDVDEVELVLPIPINRDEDSNDTINDRLNDTLNDDTINYTFPDRINHGRNDRLNDTLNNDTLNDSRNDRVNDKLNDTLNGDTPNNDTLNDKLNDRLNDTVNDSQNNDTLNDRVNDSRNDRVNDKLNDTLNDDTINDKLNDRLNELNDKLNDRLKATYTIVRSNPGIQRKGISEISGKSLPTIDRHIAILIKEGLIEHRNSRKSGGYYAI